MLGCDAELPELPGCDAELPELPGCDAEPHELPELPSSTSRKTPERDRLRVPNMVMFMEIQQEMPGNALAFADTATVM